MEQALSAEAALVVIGCLVLLGTVLTDQWYMKRERPNHVIEVSISVGAILGTFTIMAGAVGLMASSLFGILSYFFP